MTISNIVLIIVCFLSLLLIGINTIKKPKEKTINDKIKDNLLL